MQDRLDELGEGVPLDTAERVQVMWTLVTDYCEMFKNTIRTWVILLVRGGGGTLFFSFLFLFIRNGLGDCEDGWTS